PRRHSSWRAPPELMPMSWKTANCRHRQAKKTKKEILTLRLIQTSLFVESRPYWAHGNKKSLFSAEVALRGLFYFHGGKPMLVLSRRLGEQIVIGGEIRIQVVAIQGNKVRIGITASPGIRVDREEIRRRLQVRASLPSGISAEKAVRKFENLK